MAYVVLLHFDQPVNPKYPTRRHYLEYAENIRTRLADHTAGDRTRTSGIMYACYERGIKFVVARIWRDATRRDGYRLRNTRKNPLLCPICNPKLALYTPYQPYDPLTWHTLRLHPDLTSPRYGDLDTLSPYQYRPKHRTRSNGESNRTSGAASTWREDVKARLASGDEPPIELDAPLASVTVVADGTYAAPNGDLYTPDLTQAYRMRWRKVQPPIEDDRSTGFDADLPY